MAKIALVTGASGGIGSACAKKLASEGYKVIVHYYRSKEEAERIADRILGMGDVVSLVEKAQEQFDEKEARELKKKLAKDQFTLWDFYNQIQQVKKMGNIKDLAGMIPGVGKAIKDVDIPDDAFKSTEAIILSMTPYEREHPEVINGSRRKRIADGSGTSLPEVNKLLKQFEGTRKVMKGAITGSLMQQLKGMRR